MQVPVRRKVDFAALALIVTLLGTLIQSTWQASRINSKVEAQEAQAQRDAAEQKAATERLSATVEALAAAVSELRTTVAILRDRDDRGGRTPTSGDR